MASERAGNHELVILQCTDTRRDFLVEDAVDVRVNLHRRPLAAQAVALGLDERFDLSLAGRGSRAVPPRGDTIRVKER